LIYTEDTRIKLGGILLPGLIKKLEIKGEALIEEVEVEGSKIKPKQAIGYEDCKINIELIVDDTEGETALRKIERIKSLFKKGAKPQPITIVSPETSAAGVSKVLFKSLSYTLTNKSSQYAVVIELWEYVPMTITATSSRSGQAGSAAELNQNYQSYLSSNRGSAPKVGDKTTSSPATEGSPPKPPLGVMIDGSFLS